MADPPPSKGEPKKIEQADPPEPSHPLAIRFDEQESTAALAAWNEIKSVPTVQAGKRTLSLAETVDLGRSAAQYITGMTSFMNWVMELGGFAQPQQAARRLVCPQCAAHNDERARFCSSCGRNIEVVHADFAVVSGKEGRDG